MRKKVVIGAIVLGVIVLLTLPVLAGTMTTVSFGMDTSTQPLLTIRGLYDGRRTVFSGLNYYLRLEPEQGTFSGWYKTAFGKTIEAHGTYKIVDNEISGRWYLSSGHCGWISGRIGI